MLVLALEFSRGCTVHAEVGTPRLERTEHGAQAVPNGNNRPTGARTG